MNKYGREVLKWKKNKLYFQERGLAGISASGEHLDMFYVVYPDGERSADIYNKTWAKQHATTITLMQLRKEQGEDEIETMAYTSPEPAGALKKKKATGVA